MSGKEVDERAVEDFMIDLATLSNASNSDSLSGGKGDEEVSSSKKRISREEFERRKMEDLLVASSTEFSRVYHSCVREEDADSLWSKFGIPKDFELRIPASNDRPDSPPEGFLCFYIAQLEAGLIFPIPSISAKISNMFRGYTIFADS
ncbi:UNVERIFIED_CONTAM: hypothetical protein Slati_3940700 [Sesamum latifolium]|uniref:Uncharacterized protein n=1 Tax=Sesamum latifolium TaxID=2727402 RepID=A0AAW2TP45_9LAMI